MELYNDEVYSFIQKAKREEVYQLEEEFNKNHPVGAKKPNQVDLDAMDKLR